MKKESVNKPEIKLIGLTTRTNNKNEMKPQTSKTHFNNSRKNIFKFDSRIAHE